MFCIKELREKAKMTRYRLYLNADISPDTLKKLETQENFTNVRLDTLIKIAAALGVKVKDLFV